MIQCAMCKGKKQILSLGNLMKDCPGCRGIGWLETPSNELKATLKDVMTSPKRIRKKKVTNEPLLQC